MTVDNSTVSYKDFIKEGNIKLNDSQEFIDFINAGHEFLIENIRNGRPIYGVTTGYGEAGQNYAAFEEAEELQYNLFSFHGCGVGDYLSQEVSRIMVTIRMISLSKGKSGISYDLLKRFELLLDKKIYPLIPSQGSVGASGDLTPLSYIAAAIAGEREVIYNGKERPTSEVYKELGITPYKFKPKEALAIMNGTAAMSAIAIDAIEKFEVLLDTSESFVASIFELLLCDITPLEPFVHDSKPFEGQRRAAANILKKCENSSLTHEAFSRYENFHLEKEQNIQDRYSIRCSPQVLGVIHDNLEIAKKWIETEINGVNDNPLIDHIGKRIYTSGNFYGGYIAHAMDTMRICVGNLADLLDKEFGLLVDHKFNKGLGESLKLNAKSTHHGFKAMQITLSSLTADVIMNTVPASLHSRPTESFNQDKVSMGTTAALHFAKQLPDLTNMLSIALMGMAQGVDLRGKDKCSLFLQKNYETIRSEVEKLTNDRRMDLDIKVVNKMIREGLFS
ncbi:histidine ammonia-lyase [Sulfurimonas gotlandica GD1]|uniref:Histidine ammonia-lyase n=1 Tax=Sulfurimonas gotlandica (strain DSM 19862 / JCM 16533 / GD1) TaxID=929558 RepID=B6BHB0_SULGG|nr:aromatic amino acid ammonia-lyase [Sulfurimonas gotlandica]EDZ63798.1 phenylalanine and histidine ammonia-lyase [Sulfurimonas gotlandica GD1]EHP29902.1 histidine ammonia-lyase [Sulfurimonas gotlandica GD1]